MGGVRKPLTAMDGTDRTMSDMGGVRNPLTAMDGRMSDMGGVRKPVWAMLNALLGTGLKSTELNAEVARMPKIDTILRRKYFFNMVSSFSRILNEYLRSGRDAHFGSHIFHRIGSYYG
jgi:hypothetical protein